MVSKALNFLFKVVLRIIENPTVRTDWSVVARLLPFLFYSPGFCLSYVLLVSPTAPSKPQAIVNPKNSVAPVLKKKTVSGFEGHDSFNYQRSTEMRCHLSAPLDSFFRLLDFGVVDKDSAWIEKNLETLEILKNFELRSNSRALSTASSVMIVGLSVNRYSHSVNQFDERKQDWLVQKFGLRRLQRIYVIQAEPPLLFFCLLDKSRLARRVPYEWPQVGTTLHSIINSTSWN